MARLEELKVELSATLKYAEEIGEKLEDATLGEAMRADYEAELEAVEAKAQDLKANIKRQEKQDDRELRIKNIGREIGVVHPDEEPDSQYNSPIDVLFDNDQFKAALQDKSVRNAGWTTGQLEFQSVAVNPVTANPDLTLVPHMRPGIVGPFVYPQRVGELFSQATMEGSHVSWLFVPSGADGAADYSAYGAEKPGPATVTLDAADVKAAKIATTFVVPDDALDDVPALRSTLENILLVGPNGIAVKAEAQYILGLGTASPQKLVGVASLSPTDVSGSGENVIEDIIFAALDIETETGFAATGVVANPADYFSLVTLKAEDGRPLFSPFGGAYGPPVGLPPLVRSKAVPAGTIYVGAWNASILYTRQATNIRATNQGLGLTDFNRTLFVAETRQALVHPYGASVYRTVEVGS